MQTTCVTQNASGLAGPVSELLVNEIARIGASPAEMRTAAAFLAGDGGLHAYAALSPRLRRLVDLLTVAGDRRPNDANGRAA